MNIIMMGVLGAAGLSAFGVFMFFRSVVKDMRKKAFEQKERAVLQQVLAHGGKVTPLEIAANVDQSFEEVKATLDRLCDCGFGQFEMTDSGSLLYVFEQAHLSNALAPASLQATPQASPAPRKPRKAPKGISQAAYDTLAALYDATDGPNWKNQDGWLKSKKLEKWHGVKVENGRVVELALGSNQLSGVLPDLRALTELRKLSLFSNQLSGPLPDVRHFPKLQVLYLHNNQFSGPVPDFAQNPQLQHIEMSHNHLQGALPEFGHLPQLKKLYLAVNHLEGPFPKFTHCQHLQTLLAYNNRFCGEIPALNHLKRLQCLRLDDNQLSGTIPDFSGLTQLKELQLQINQLSGSLPGFETLLQLEEFSAHENMLGGRIPDYSHLRRLRSLRLRKNLLNGPIPDLSRNLSLNHLYLNDNQLDGPLPDFLNLPRLRWVDLSNNLLKGPLPPLGPSSTLEYLNLDKNQFNGPIPVPGDLPRMKATNLKLQGNFLCRSAGADYGKFADALKDIPECPKAETPGNSVEDVKNGLEGIQPRFSNALSSSGILFQRLTSIASGYQEWLPELLERFNELAAESEESAALLRFKGILVDEVTKYRQAQRNSQFPEGEESDEQFRARMRMKLSSGPMLSILESALRELRYWESHQNTAAPADTIQKIRDILSEG